MKCWGIQFSSNPCWFEVGKIKVDKGPGRLRVLGLAWALPVKRYKLLGLGSAEQHGVGLLCS